MIATDIEFKAKGTDSLIFLIKKKNVVMKVYDRLTVELDWGLQPENVFKLMNLYAEDTLKAAKIIDSEWVKIPKKNRQVILDSKSYTINVIVLPQGDPELVSTSSLINNLREETWKYEKYVALIGQKYVDGPNLQDILHSRMEIDTIYTPIKSHHRKIGNIKSMIKEIIDAKAAPFMFSDCNIKPRINEKEKILDLIITDIASDIIFKYEKYLEDKCNYFKDM